MVLHLHPISRHCLSLFLARVKYTLPSHRASNNSALAKMGGVGYRICLSPGTLLLLVVLANRGLSREDIDILSVRVPGRYQKHIHMLLINDCSGPRVEGEEEGLPSMWLSGAFY
jgi:hypothetical protein